MNKDNAAKSSAIFRPISEPNFKFLGTNIEVFEWENLFELYPCFSPEAVLVYKNSTG
jgi:hypothetical protein